MKTFLLWCTQQHVSFRMQEIESLLSMLKITCTWVESKFDQPFLVVKMNSEENVRKLVSRSILIRSAYELWGLGSSMKELVESLKSLPPECMDLYRRNNESFKFSVETYGKKISLSSKIQKIEELDFMSFEGPISLNDPDHQFTLFEFYGMDKCNVPEQPERVYFGRWIGDGQKRSSHIMNLSKRFFIGNTSMDPTLALIMANMAQVQEHSLVLDPFVGSGSLLVASGWFGGYVLGTDINYLMLHGKAKPSRINTKERQPDEGVRQNMCQYNLESQYLDVVVADASLPLWRQNCFIDAIIADPPYGIRESTERIGSKKKNKIPAHLAEQHIPSKVSYNLQDIVCDLLNFSATHLRLHGRLVYWMPVFKADFSPENIPSHPALKLVSYSDQALSKQSSRYLITMEKVKQDPESEAFVQLMARDFREKYFRLKSNK